MALLMTDLNQIILSCLIFCPLVGALLVALLPRKVAREGAFAVAAVNFVLSLHLWAHWDEAKTVLAGALNGKEVHFQELHALAPNLGVSYHLGVDGISVFLVLLTTFLTPIVLLMGWNAVGERAKEYAVCLLLVEGAVVGVFSALDLILFYMFWEAVLIPIYIQMVGWGGPRKAYAAGKLFVYTMLGSVFMWVGMLYLYFQQPAGTRSFDYSQIMAQAQQIDKTGGTIALVLFGAFAIAFAIKAPIFPLHTWLPDAYSQAPTGTTVMLAAVLSKMGIYGFLRFAIPFFPSIAQQVAPIMIALAAVGIIYGAIVASAQTDIKRLLAYSSVSHVSLIVLGVFAIPLAGANGAIAASGATLQMVNHGLSTGALFLLAGLLYERRGTYEAGEYGGVANVMPRYTVLFWVAMFASIGLPGLNGFVGEYLILQGAMSAGFLYAALGATGVVLGAIYMLRMFRTVAYGEVTREENKKLLDVSPRETVGLALVLALIVWIGVAPQQFLNIVNPDAAALAAPSGETAVASAVVPEDQFAQR
jgi:NADH-quinone oxidoreductase subunit M